jgi:hypothetical protein
METATVERKWAVDEWVARWWKPIVVIILLAALSGVALLAGLKLRRWAWDFTEDVRFRGDVNNAVYWGRESADAGLFRMYDAVDQGALSEPDRKIDYPPLRLAMAAAWWKWWIHPRYPDATEWQEEYEFTKPMLDANLAAELASCVLVFLVVWLWRVREETAAEKTFFTGVFAGSVGAIIFWFNPAIIWNAHCWPQWDVWPIPFFLAAVLLASLDWWMAAGVCLAIGASLKGQLLLAAPVMVVWPIVRLHIGDAMKLASGFLLATMVIALPWMLSGVRAWCWLVVFAWGIVVMLPWVFRMKFPRELVWALAAVGILVAWPWGTVEGVMRWRSAAVVLMVLVGLSRWLPVRVRGAVVGLAIAGAILLLMPLFGASSNWFTYGFQYGTRKFDYMVTGNGAYNVPRMLMVYYDSPQHADDLVTLPWIGDMTFTNATRIVYGIAVVLCGIGAAIQDRRKNARVLAALMLPWLLFFLILTQMHGRYGVWAAGISAVLMGVNTGLGLLGIIISIVSFLGMMQNQMLFQRDWWPTALETVQGMDPGLGWALLVCAGVIFYFAVVPKCPGRVAVVR